MAKTSFRSVDAYIAAFPPEVKARLASIRRTIRKAAPAAEEVVSYGMPAYRLHGPLVYFGAFKDHTSLFPASDGARRAFRRRLARFDGGKGTVQFPHKRAPPPGPHPRHHQVPREGEPRRSQGEGRTEGQAPGREGGTQRRAAEGARAEGVRDNPQGADLIPARTRRSRRPGRLGRGPRACSRGVDDGMYI